MNPNRTTVLIADAHCLSRVGLQCMLQRSGRFEVVGQALDRNQLLVRLIETQPDVVVLDYHTTEGFCLEDIGDIRKYAPETGILAITNDGNKQRIAKSLDLGVTCYVTKACSEGEILDSVAAAAKGEKFFCNKILQVLVDERESPSNCDPSCLTVRELEIVRLIAGGISTRDIASQLFLSVHTIYTHRKNILRKLGLPSSSVLIRWALDEGIA